MQTRAQAATNARSSPERMAPPVRSNARRLRDLVHNSILKMGERIADLEAKDVWNESHRQAVMRISKMLEGMCVEFKAYHYDIVAGLESDEDATKEQSVFDEHQRKTMEFIDRLGDLLTRSQPSVSAPSSSQDRLIDRQLELIDASVKGIKRDIEAPGGKDVHVLTNYMDKIKSLEGKLEGLQMEILSLDDYGWRLERASGVERTLFGLKVALSRLMEETKGELDSKKVVGVPMLSGANLPRIEIPTFDGNILNWRLFWEQFQAAVHDKPHLGEIDKLTYLRDALKNGPARTVVQGLTQTADSYQEAVRCLKERYDRPRLIHREHVRSIIQAPPLKACNGRELRRLYDLCNQHIRAIKASDDYEIDTLLTIIMELKLDEVTKLKWMEHSNHSKTTPPHSELLKFLDLQAQHFESAPPERKLQTTAHKTYAAATEETCIACGRGNHSVGKCYKLQDMTREERWDVVIKGALCRNCLKPGHIANKCRAPPMCETCHKYHHTLLHKEAGTKPERGTTTPKDTTYAVPSRRGDEVLLMTCRVKVISSDGSVTQARALLDCAASTSLITERLAQQLRLPRRPSNFTINGVAGVNVRPKGTVKFKVAGARGGREIEVEASVLPKVTADLPTVPVSPVTEWKHLTGLELADPDYGVPARIDMLLGGKVFSKAVLHGRRFGPTGAPSAFKTCFGWVLNGEVRGAHRQNLTHVCCVALDDDTLKRFWEIEDYNLLKPIFSPEERAVVEHFENFHTRDKEGRFIVPLPRKVDVTLLGESRDQALRRFKRLEQSLRANGKFGEFAEVIHEYFEMGHAEHVPQEEVDSPHLEAYYLPMHAVHKEESTTSKLRVVFDASARTTSGSSLNDHLLVGPTVHPSLIDVLLRFRRFRVALTTDVSRMYRAVRLPDDQKDLHRFLWRDNPRKKIMDYRMTRLTFGVSASSFAANMALRQNALSQLEVRPQAARVALESFYVDDGLFGADSTHEAVQLREEIQELFKSGGFKLRKWKSSEREVLASVPEDLRDTGLKQEIHHPDEYTKVLGVEWNMVSDCFRPVIASSEGREPLTKRVLVSNIARLFDVLGWCSPTVILMKIMLQRLWESNLTWDEPVPEQIEGAWNRWHRELPTLKNFQMPRSYFPKDFSAKTVQLHGFCDASEAAYSGVVYVRAEDEQNNVHTSLVLAKTKVAPLKRLSIPRLELCGAVILAKLLHHVAKILEIPYSDVFAWTDSLVTLGWLQGSPRRFLPFVGNRVAEITEAIPVACWRHVKGINNPADCASRGMFPAELVEHTLWREGPQWLRGTGKNWDKREVFDQHPVPAEEREVQQTLLPAIASDLSSFERISDYNRLLHVTGWIQRFVNNTRRKDEKRTSRVLSLPEIMEAEETWWRLVQSSTFREEIQCLEGRKRLSPRSRILPFHPFLDSKGLLRVGGRLQKAEISFSERHPILLPGNHRITKLLITAEHLRLLHAGPTLTSASLSRRVTILGGRRAIRTITSQCVTCRKVAARPAPQIHGQLPADRVRPGQVFDCVGIDYAGPVLVKYGPVRKPRFTKGYVAVFVCLATKAVHLELVSDLTTSALIATLRRFVGRRGIPSTLWSDHGTNFVGAERELQNLLRDEDTARVVQGYCNSHRIKWKFIPERTPHFGGLWEAAVKSFKSHLRKVLGEARLNFEEFSTVLVQIEACLNSRPLTPLPEATDALEVLTPGHFLIGRPLVALPEENEQQVISPLRRWHLCQSLSRHLWTRWSREYLDILGRFSKWHEETNNYQVGDIVCLREEPTAPTKWPLARIIRVYPGPDGKVRVVTVKTSKGVYNRPVVKLVPLVQEPGPK